MARTIRTLRDDLELAAAVLHDPSSEVSDEQRAAAADAVDAILEPGGWTQLREEEGPHTTNLPLTIRKSQRDALKAAAKMKRRTLTGLITKGYQEVLAGTWTPPERPKHSKHAADDPRVVLNVTLVEQLRKDLRDRIPALEKKLGYKVTEGGIALEYLVQKALVKELAQLLPKKTTAE